MANIPPIAPVYGDMVQALWFVSLGRWMQGIYVISGGATAPASGMDVAIDELVTPYGTTAADASFTIDAHHDTLARIDILYQTAAGAFAIHKGDNAAIVDPLGGYNPTTHANWTQLSSPRPKDGLPAGVPMYMIFVAPAVTEIIAADIVQAAAIGVSTGENYVWETMTATGTAHTLGHLPVANTLLAFRNGQLIKEGAGDGYTRVTTAVTLTTARGDDVIMYWYRY